MSEQGLVGEDRKATNITYTDLIFDGLSTFCRLFMTETYFWIAKIIICLFAGEYRINNFGGPL